MAKEETKINDLVDALVSAYNQLDKLKGITQGTVRTMMKIEKALIKAGYSNFNSNIGDKNGKAT